MARRLAIVLALALLATSPAWGQGVGDRQQAIDDKIAQLRAKIADANRREGVLTSEISAVTSKIRGLQTDVDSASARVTQLERELTVYKNRLAVLEQIYRLQTEKLRLLRRQHEIAQRRLEERLIAIYQSEDASAVDVMLAASSFADFLDGLEYVNEIGRQDRSIAGQVLRAKRDVRQARERTRRTRARVGEAARAIEVRTEQERAERDRLLASQQALAAARGEKRSTLASIQTDEREFLHEVEGLERASAALAARIRAAQSASSAAASGSTSASGFAPASTGTVSAAGLIWPVAGPVTSGFGWRWGRMHEGIDIAAPTGAPIQASASGVVIFAGWLGGYGNLVVVDHGGGLATAYGHMSTIGAGGGQAVAQGQVIGYVGCTGHCFGSHLHFEVRVNGGAVDPLGYL